MILVRQPWRFGSVAQQYCARTGCFAKILDDHRHHAVGAASGVHPQHQARIWTTRYQGKISRLSSTKSSPGDAEAILKDSQWFGKASPSLQKALSSKMTLVEADRGHVFIEEGEEIKNILMLETGSIVRSKRALGGEGTTTARLRDMSQDERLSFLKNDSVYVDTITGRGQVSGLLHGVHKEAEKRIAFASVTASSEEETKVWTIPNDEFRQVICSDPNFGLDILQAVSTELHTGSKNLRSIVQAVRFGVRGGKKSSGDTIKVLCYDSTNWVRNGFSTAVEEFNEGRGEDSDSGVRIEMDYTTERLSSQSAMHAAGYDAVCLFVNDDADSNVIQTLSLIGVRCIAMRCAGFDRVDSRAALTYGMTVCRVPAYSPYAVAEHAVALLMAVNRKIARANNRVKMANFTLDAGLMGMDIFGKTVGVMGTGKIGQCLCNIMLGFGTKLLCYDVIENEELKAKGAKYVSRDEMYEQCDVIFLMMPMLAQTHHTIDENVLPKLKKGVLLINTSRGGLVDTGALLKGLRSGIIGGVGMDVYENEGDYFFQDWSAMHLQDPQLMALLGDQNVVLTAHQAFFTKEAIDKIVSTTIENLKYYQLGKYGIDHPNNCLPKSSSD